MSSVFESPLYIGFFVTQYALLFGVLIWWFYTKRVKRGFRVQFVAEINAQEKGGYSLALADVGGEKDFVRVTKDMEAKGIRGNARRMVQLVDVVRGVSPNQVIFLDDVEVKAGQEFCMRDDKAFRIPWEMVAFREFGWEYMVINLSNMTSIDFSGSAGHYYDPTETCNILGGKFFLGRFRLQNPQSFLLLVVMGICLAVFASVVVVYFVMTGALGFVKIPVGFNGSIVNGTIVGGVI